MPCPSVDQLVSYVSGDLDAALQNAVSEHLASRCTRCDREISTIGELRRLGAGTALDEPPPWVLLRAQAIPAEPPASRRAALLGTVALLVFDTLRDPLPQGARSMAVASRQMLFQASGYDLDVRVMPQADGLFRVSGQILPGPDRPLDVVSGVDVALASETLPDAVCTTNELGEFGFEPVPAGSYSLAVETEEERLLADPLVIAPSA